jgi:ATP-binding cassette subfamily C (CFTR/MRP) protein 1
MGMYAGIGVFQAVFTFALGAAISFLTYFASASLHGQSIQRIFLAPMSWFASIPLGRIMNTFGKVGIRALADDVDTDQPNSQDVDVLDSLLADSLRMSVMICGAAHHCVVKEIKLNIDSSR